MQLLLLHQNICFSCLCQMQTKPLDYLSTVAERFGVNVSSILNCNLGSDARKGMQNLGEPLPSGTVLKICQSQNCRIPTASDVREQQRQGKELLPGESLGGHMRQMVAMYLFYSSGWWGWVEAASGFISKSIHLTHTHHNPRMLFTPKYSPTSDEQYNSPPLHLKPSPHLLVPSWMCCQDWDPREHPDAQ